MKKYIISLLMIFIFSAVSAYAADGGTEYEITLLTYGGFPHYHAFTDNYEELKDDIAAELENRANEIEVETDLNAEELSLVFEAAVNENPLIDYIEETVCISETDGGYIIYPTYDESETEVELMSYKTELAKLLGCVDSSMSDVEKCLAVHNYMVTHYEYDLTYENHTMKSMLRDGRGVCQAYSLTYEYVLTELGIECVTISSASMNHAWNMVKLDGEWYHVDVTWDDPVEDCYGTIYHYEYFLISDDAISDEWREHYGWESPYKASSTKYNEYFWSTLLKRPLTYKNGYWYYYNDYTVYRYSFTTNSSYEYKNVRAADSQDNTCIYGNYIYGIDYWNDVPVLIRTDITSEDWEIIYIYSDADWWDIGGFLIDEDGLTVYDPPSDFLNEYFTEDRAFDDAISTDYYDEKEIYIYTVDVSDSITKIDLPVSVEASGGSTSITAVPPSGYTAYYMYDSFDDSISAAALLDYTDNADLYDGTIEITCPGMYKVSLFGVNDEGKYTNVEEVIVTNCYSGTAGELSEASISRIISESGSGRILNGNIKLAIDSELEKIFASRRYITGVRAISYQCLMAIYSGGKLIDVLPMSERYSTSAYFEADNIELPADECTIKVFLWQTSSDGKPTMFPIAQAAEITI